MIVHICATVMLIENICETVPNYHFHTMLYVVQEKWLHVGIIEN